MEKTEGNKKVCPECGRIFHCLGNSSCWCLDYHLLEKNREMLSSKYDDCLCEECLNRYSTGKKRE